jgi:hypothetical protein
VTLVLEVPQEAVEAAAKAEWDRYGSNIPNATWETEDPEYKETLRSAVRSSLAAAMPFMNRVVTSGEGLLPGTVLQDKTGDVLKLLDNGEWWGTDEDGPTFVDYPATVLVEGGKGRPYGYNDN